MICDLYLRCTGTQETASVEADVGNSEISTNRFQLHGAPPRVKISMLSLLVWQSSICQLRGVRPATFWPSLFQSLYESHTLVLTAWNAFFPSLVQASASKLGFRRFDCVGITVLKARYSLKRPSLCQIYECVLVSANPVLKLDGWLMNRSCFSSIKCLINEGTVSQSHVAHPIEEW